jgi:hypothetical protein
MSIKKYRFSEKTPHFPCIIPNFAAAKDESVQESVAHLCYYIDYQYPNLGVPHFSEHSPKDRTQP